MSIVLVSVGGGALALTHRPKLRALSELHALGATHVVTLLGVTAEGVGAARVAWGDSLV